jgi:4a-hydroxytetrahydrobiopterin dehydratase
MSTLSEAEIATRLEKLPDWSPINGEIRKTFQLPSFPAALMFVTAVGQLAETADHHPDIDVRYRKVTLTLSTHSAGGLTDKDFALATKIEALLAPDAC